MLARDRNPAMPDSTPDLPRLFHKLNNQLGIILANAELLEKRIADDTHRARAGQVVSSVVEAIATTQQIRHLATGPDARLDPKAVIGTSIA